MKKITSFLFLFVLTTVLLLPFENGTYNGISIGSDGPMKVRVIVSDNRIIDVKILKHKKSVTTDFMKVITERIIKKGDYEGVETVTGAIIDSKAILKAVENALLKAQKTSNKKTVIKNEILMLTPPEKSGGRSLTECLWKRKTQRKFSSKSLPLKTLSNLLWSARGMNRKKGKKLTVPSAFNWQQIDVYVALQNGLFLYNSQKHQLEKVLSKDLRRFTGSQWFKKLAPVALVYVVDYDRMTGGGSMEEKLFYAATDTGFISQNVYLYCASKDLATVVLGGRKGELEKKMKLRQWQKVILTQTVGYPAE
ncbi:nitroreductase family protein [bacterium]|nr:nitroreductase family protein [bacterium]